MHKFLIVPICPTPFLGQEIMRELSMGLLMGHLPGLLMLQKGPQRAHEIPLEVNQQVRPLCLVSWDTQKGKTVIPVKIQLKDPQTLSQL
jgi:hypothetical protein